VPESEALLEFRHEDCSGKRWYSGGSRFRVECRLPGDWIAGSLLHGMQMQLQALQLTIGESDQCISGVEEALRCVFVHSVVSAVRVELHDDQARCRF